MTKIMFASLGCDKNLVDSEMMLGQLREKGYSFTDDETQADVVVVNTCCFIKDAKEESIQTILEMAQLRESGQLKALVVTGCLAQRYQEEIQKEIPEVDVILGIQNIDAIVEKIEAALQGNCENLISDKNSPLVYGKKRIVTTGGHFAYLKIAEGCDKHCTYCIIPKIRGDFRSVPMEVLLKEAEELVNGGVQELILVAQETTVYGTDLYGKKMLPKLLEELCQIADLRWIRLLYCYPEEITQELIDVMKREKKVLPYLDMPIQHASDAILKRMGRRCTEEELRSLIAHLREEIPEICLRTTLITGFPGETQEDHETLYRFVNEMEFDRLGVFTYSPEENTPAATMPDQIDEQVKEERRGELMELQQAIAFEKAEAMSGKELDIIIEGYLPEDDVYVGRTYKDAPGVDGMFFLRADRELVTGSFVRARVTGSDEYDLIGEEINESAE
ncbi:MAG: 30S ribosomal protein S12 methylthiotransferase RimO [Lachnospiraceae bacterium]|nr:30S ribosomal protein S12 methylthiotransferase RimO [Lachnospiraceae bacterium]